MELLKEFIENFKNSKIKVRFSSKRELWIEKGYSIEYDMALRILQLTSFLDKHYKKVTPSQRFWHILNNKLELNYCSYCNIKVATFSGTYSSSCCKKCDIELSRKRVSDNYKNNPSILEKRKQTNLSLYGQEHCCQNETYKEKIRNTNKRNIGYAGPFANPDFNKKIANSNSVNKIEINKKRRATCQEKYNADSYFQTTEFLEKREQVWIQKYGTTNIFDVSHPRTKTYKNTNLIYQSSYEKHFLDLLKEKELLVHVKRGPVIEYLWKENIHKYYPDFIINDTVIEIKSDWTYSREVELVQTKLKATQDKGYKVVLLKSLEEIEEFTNRL